MSLDRNAVISAAERLVAQRRIRDAIAEYQKLVWDNPRDVSALNRIGDLHFRLGDLSEAADLFTEVAEFYAREGVFIKAISIYKKINKLDPARLGVYEALGDLTRSRDCFRKQRLSYEF